MRRRSRNRKSLLAEEAQRQGINLNVTSSAQRPPRPPQQSGHNMVGAATPLSGFSQIPRRFNMEEIASARRANQGKQSSVQPGSAMASRQGRVSNRAAGSLRRSYSTEFLLNGTTAFVSRTPRNRSQSPGNSLMSGSTSRLNGIVDPAGTCKYPDFKETKLLDEMTSAVAEKLGFLRYPKQFTPKEVKDISSKDFNAVCLWLIERLYAPYTGAKNTKDELKFIQSSLGPGKLGFPAIINVTNLSMPNTQSGRPYAQTILFFLTCTLEEMESTDFEEALEDENDKPDWLLFETYAQLMWKQTNNCSVNVDEELQIFSEKLDQFCDASSDGRTSEQLNQELEEQQAKLASVAAAADPRSDILRILRNLDEKIMELEAQFKLTESENAKFKDLSALENESCALEFELERAKRRLVEMQARIKKQDMSLEEAKGLIGEMDALKLEQEPLKRIMKDLSQKKTKLTQFVENDEKRCYDEIAKLSIVDEYNNEAKKWNGVVAPIKTNPLKLEELPSWTSIVEGDIKKAGKALEDHRGKIKGAMLSSKKSKLTLEAEVAEIRKTYNDIRSKRDQEVGEQLVQQNQLKQELAELKSREDKLVKELHEQTDAMKSKQSEVAEDATELESDKIKIVEVKDIKNQWDEEVESLNAAFHSTAMKKLGDLTTGIAAVRIQMGQPVDIAAIEAEVKAELAAKFGLNL